MLYTNNDLHFHVSSNWRLDCWFWLGLGNLNSEIKERNVKKGNSKSQQFKINFYRSFKVTHLEKCGVVYVYSLDLDVGVKRKGQRSEIDKVEVDIRRVRE